jgi:MYXO-CTERM domain-containing protein
MKRFYIGAALLGLLSLAGPAEAGSLYDFSFSGGGLSGSGTFDVSFVPASGMTPGGDFATSSTGSVSGDPNISDLSNLVPNTNAPGSTPIPSFGGVTSYSYDNQLLLGSSPLLTGNGLLWTTGSGASTVLGNLYYWPGGGGASAGYYFLDSQESMANSGAFGTPVSFTLASVPEPSTLVSGGMAVLVGLGLAWRRRRKALAA